MEIDLIHRFPLPSLPQRGLGMAVTVTYAGDAPQPTPATRAKGQR